MQHKIAFLTSKPNCYQTIQSLQELDIQPLLYQDYPNTHSHTSQIPHHKTHILDPVSFNQLIGWTSASFKLIILLYASLVIYQRQLSMYVKTFSRARSSIFHTQPKLTGPTWLVHDWAAAVQAKICPTILKETPPPTNSRTFTQPQQFLQHHHSKCKELLHSLYNPQSLISQIVAVLFLLVPC